MAAFAAVLIIGAGGFWLYDSNKTDTQSSDNESTTQQIVVPASKITISEDEKTVSYEGQTGSTALEVLKTLADVTTEDSSFGEFVTGINGQQADGSSEYWSFYVGGEYASEGAGTYQTTDGEQIEWVLESL